jgi:hypothetical protein
MNTMKEIAIILIVFLLVGFSLIEAVNANPGFVEAPAIHIIHPERIASKCYTSTTVPVTIEVLVLEKDVSQVVCISYCLDFGAIVTFVNFTESGSYVSFTHQSVKSLRVNSTLSNLAEGKHTLKAYSVDFWGRIMSTETTFLVNTSYVSPKVSIVSPQGNQVYTRSEIPFSFWVNSDFKSAYYYLDNEHEAAIDSIYAFSPPVPGRTISGTIISGNLTLSNLSEGKHDILFYVTFNDIYHKYPIMTSSHFFVNTTKTENNLPLDNQTPSVPELSWLIILPLLVTILSFVVAKRFMKNERCSG